jgi:type III secretion system YscQ/HrcQ family protein
VVDLELTVGEERGRGRLLVPGLALRALGGPAAEVRPPLADLRLPCSFRDGTASIPRQDLEALGAGDVLLLDEGAVGQELVLPGGLALRGRTEGDFFHVEDLRMTETQASYPLTLSVEVARVTVTFGELARLEPGAVLALDARRDGAVVLRAGERAIARGQLVEVEGALGVRVLELGDVP